MRRYIKREEGRKKWKRIKKMKEGEEEERKRGSGGKRIGGE